MQVLEQLDKETELMKKYGPEETTYACLYEAKDMPLVQKFFSKVSAEDPPEVIEFFQKCEQKWNDHDPSIKIGNKEFRFSQVAKALDIPTIQGIALCMKGIAIAITPFRYMAVGTDSREQRTYQSQLFGETSTRMDMTVAASGSISRAGESMVFIGIFPVGYATITVRESGVWNVSSGSAGTMLNRNMFKDFPIAHTQGVSGFTVGSRINWGAVTTWG